ncbi:MAG TPA: efflux RND transporter periplasmic adaptor subunit, partial [Labilithrix sp.]|nr:efflux RND transporter periplasmic adaptor subunit [Labilithrix sp.]
MAHPTVSGPDDADERLHTISIAPSGSVLLRSGRPDPLPEAIEPAAPKTDVVDARSPGTSKRGRLLVVAGLVVALATAQGIRMLSAGTETTDNAVVSARVVGVSCEVSGTVREVLVNEHEHVEAGAVLMRLDTTAVDVRVARARAELASSQAGLEQATTKAAAADKQVTAHVSVARGDEIAASARQKSIAAETREAEASVQAAQARLDLAHAELGSALRLHEKRSLSSSQLEESKTKAAHAEAELRRAQAVVARTLAEQAVADGARRAATGKVQFTLSGVDVKVADAEARLASARVDEARALVDLAELERSRATVVAPFAGVIEKRRVEPGSYVTPGAEHFLLVATDKLWVEANFKESQLG